MLGILLKLIIVVGFVAFGAAASALQDVYARHDGTRATVLSCWVLWQQYLDAQSCARQSHRCPRDARVVRVPPTAPCADK